MHRSSDKHSTRLLWGDDARLCAGKGIDLVLVSLLVKASCRLWALQVKALQGDVEEVSPHILHSLLLLFIFLAAFLPVRLQLVSASPPPPQVTSPANQTLLHTFIFHWSLQPLLFPLFLFFPFLHSFPSPTPPLVSHLVSCFLPFFLCSSVSRSLPVNLLIAH